MEKEFGRHRIRTPEEMQQKVDAYFRACDTNMETRLVGTGMNAAIMTVPEPKTYTWTGLALAVGLTSRTALLNYYNRDEYHEVLLEAKMRIKDQWEGKLARLGNNSGVIFNLTNSQDAEDTWSNKQDLNLGGQPDNPVKVENQLSIEQLRKIKEVLGNGPV